MQSLQIRHHICFLSPCGEGRHMSETERNVRFSLMKRQAVVTHTISQTKIPALLRQLGYKHTFRHNAVSTKKLLVFTFSQKHIMLKCWSIEDRSGFFLSPVKLSKGGLRQIAVS
jgi:hypothetical protein